MGVVVASVYKRPTIPLWSSLATVLVFVALSIVLIPTHGAMGPAIASLAAMSTFAIVTYWLSRPILHLLGYRSEIAVLQGWYRASR